MSALAPLFGIWILVVMSPGPDFLVTVRYATARSRRHGVAVGLGVSSALLLWAAGSMVGLSVLLARLSWLYDTIRLAGAAYLIYLGLRTLWSSRRGAPAPDATGRPAAAAPVPEPAGLARAWRVGFLTNLGNPKAAVFFSSLFGALLPAHTALGLRIGLVPAMVSVAFAWFSLVASLFGLPSVVRVYRRARRWIDRLMAALLIAFGGRLALDR